MSLHPGCRGAQPLSAIHPATAHCLTPGPRPRFLGLNFVNSEATANGVSFRRLISSVVPHSGRKPTYMITVPSTAMKIPACSFLSEPPPWEATCGTDSLPHGAAVSHTAFKCICWFRQSHFSSRGVIWDNPLFWLVGLFLDGKPHSSKDCSSPPRISY